MNMEYDFEPIMRGLRNIRQTASKPGTHTIIAGAVESLRALPFPEAYLDGIRDELLMVLKGASRNHPCSTHVYLAFYGEEKASFLKVGIARNVRRRLSGISTGNPLPNLCTFSAPFMTRPKAERIEAALLKHLSVDKVHGEWVSVHGLSREACKSVADSLAEVASEIAGYAVEFNELGI